MFIEVPENNGSVVLVNINMITAVYKYRDNGIRIYLSGSTNSVYTTMSYEELRQTIMEHVQPRG